MRHFVFLTFEAEWEGEGKPLSDPGGKGLRGGCTALTAVLTVWTQTGRAPAEELGVLKILCQV